MFSKLVIPSVLLVAPALGEWHTVLSCIGDVETDRIALDNFDVIAAMASGLRMCLMDSETECVVAKDNNGALDYLRHGEFNIQPDMVSCDLDCIKERWTGPEPLLKMLTWGCRPAFDRYVYQACGNPNGVHFDSLSKSAPAWYDATGHGDAAGYCTWRFKDGDINHMAMVVQVDAPLYWHTVYGCEGHKAMERSKLRNVNQVASDAFGLRVCETGKDKCVVATEKNQGLASLASGGVSIQPPGVDKCDSNCVDEMWKGWHGTGEMKSHMGWNCMPKRDFMVFHACNNGEGLHIDSRSGNSCGWNWAAEDDISVQVLVMTDDSYERERNTCVAGGVMEEVQGLTVGQCQELCTSVEECKAVAYGVDYGSPMSLVQPGNCVLHNIYEAWRNDCDGVVNGDVYVKGDYERFDKACVNTLGDDSLDYFMNQSVRDCASRCDQHYLCKAFEYGVAHHGAGIGFGAYPGDCVLHKSYYRGGCDNDHTDVFVKHSATPKPTPEPTPKPTPEPTFAPEQREWTDHKLSKLVQRNVCFGSKGGKYGEFTLSRDASVHAIYLVHRSGGVHNVRFPAKSCADEVDKFGSSGQGRSNFGGECKDAVSVYVTDSSDNTVAPVDTTYQYTPLVDSRAPVGKSGWYTLSGYNSHSKYIALQSEVAMEMTAGTYRVWHGEDLYDFHEHDNSGESCVDVYVFEDVPVLPLVDGRFYRIAENVCVGASGDRYGRFTVPFGTMAARRVLLKHRGGYVNCKRTASNCPALKGKDNPYAYSNFGCDCSDDIRIFVTDDNNNRVVPSASYIRSDRYKLPGYHSHSKEIMFHGSFVFSTGAYRIWYGEDLINISESDNHGVACYDVLAEVDIYAGFQ